jgi:hypothetical protein
MTQSGYALWDRLRAMRFSSGSMIGLHPRGARLRPSWVAAVTALIGRGLKLSTNLVLGCIVASRPPRCVAPGSVTS